jgi:tetratricopeptide (TPR) repeat protein
LAVQILLLGVFGALLAFDAPTISTNVVVQEPTVSTNVPDRNDPVEKAYRKLMEDDDDAQDEAQKWIKAAREASNRGDKGPSDTLSYRLHARFEPVRNAYAEFLAAHPKHARGHIAFGSFLNDIGEEDAAVEEWEKAKEADPGIPSTWNNLANYYGHRGPVRKAFRYYEKAIELDPRESVYYWNMATTVYLFRKDAMELYDLDETKVFDKALALYRKAIKMDPTNFVLASDYANSFYGTKPPRWKDGLEAWEEAMKVAPTDVEREGIRLHYARTKIRLGRFDEAEAELNCVTNSPYLSLKKNLRRNLDEARAKATNGPVAAPAPVAATDPAPAAGPTIQK